MSSCNVLLCKSSSRKMRQTSIFAYQKIKEDLGEKQKQVFNTIIILDGATNKQIASYLKLPINCVTPRTKELYDKGLVFKKHTVSCPITNKPNTVWGYVK